MSDWLRQEPGLGWEEAGSGESSQVESSRAEPCQAMSSRAELSHAKLGESSREPSQGLRIWQGLYHELVGCCSDAWLMDVWNIGA